MAACADAGRCSGALREPMPPPLLCVVARARTHTTTNPPLFAATNGARGRLTAEVLANTTRRCWLGAMADAAYQRALELVAQEEYAAAQQQFDEAIALSPQPNAGYLLQRGTNRLQLRAHAGEAAEGRAGQSERAERERAENRESRKS